MRFYNALMDLSHRALNLIQHVVGNPIWVLANTVLFILWMLIQVFLRHPIDPPAMFYPGTVWAMTVLGYIVELAMKAQNQLIFDVQQKQAEMQQEQMDRMEFLLRYVKDQGDTIEQMFKENAQKDMILRHVVSQWREVAETLMEKKRIV